MDLDQIKDAIRKWAETLPLDETGLTKGLDELENFLDDLREEAGLDTDTDDEDDE